MKYKIVFFLPNLNGGGAERVAVNMIRQLDLELFSISLILVQKTGEYLDHIPAQVDIINLNMNKTIFSIYKLHKIIKKLKPDIVYSTLYRTSIALYLSLLGQKKKHVTILRNPTSPKLVLEEKSLSPMMKFLLEKSYHNADCILAQTPEMKDEISQYHHICKEKIKVFLNPIDITNIKENINEIENPFSNNKINIVAAGRLGKEKGFDILLKSLKYVIEQDEKYFLNIIGKESGEEKNLYNLVNELNLTENVKFWGFQKNPYKFFYFSDLYVLSSRREGLPNTVLENLYLKKPIVATNCIPFMYDLIDNNINGYIVDVEDVEGLANAILNYKKLNTTSKIWKGSDVNKLFGEILDIKKEKTA